MIGAEDRYRSYEAVVFNKGNWIVKFKNDVGPVYILGTRLKMPFYCAIHRFPFLWMSMDFMKILLYLESRGNV